MEPTYKNNRAFEFNFVEFDGNEISFMVVPCLSAKQVSYH